MIISYSQSSSEEMPPGCIAVIFVLIVAALVAAFVIPLAGKGCKDAAIESYKGKHVEMSWHEVKTYPVEKAGRMADKSIKVCLKSEGKEEWMHLTPQGIERVTALNKNLKLEKIDYVPYPKLIGKEAEQFKRLEAANSHLQLFMDVPEDYWDTPAEIRDFIGSAGYVHLVRYKIKSKVAELKDLELIYAEVHLRPSAVEDGTKMPH